MKIEELKCWPGYQRVPGTKAGAVGSCRKKSSKNEGAADLTSSKAPSKNSANSSKKTKESVNYNGAFWLSQVQGGDSPVSPVGAVPKGQRINTKKAPNVTKKLN